tara:strand:+ start:291 stop:560 length:270 start_codon:yes stop_codon:yes gene_type:complete
MSITHDVKIIDKINLKESFFCNICGFPLRLKEDFSYNQEYSCCNECYLTFAESRRKDWKDGWRPDQREVEEYIYNRKLMYKCSGENHEV